MKAVTVQFNYQDRHYEALLDVFIESWKRNASIPLEVRRIAPPEVGKRNKGFYFNHRKLYEWVSVFDQDTIFVDCDMLLREDIADGFDQVSHIGATTRRPPFPYNGGCVFAKFTQKSRSFLKKWLEVDGRMLGDVSLHLPYREKYAGINQSSFGWMLENGYRNCVQDLPESYNLCDGWPDWENAKMIHVKGRLRRHVLGIECSSDQTLNRIKNEWSKFVLKV